MPATGYAGAALSAIVVGIIVNALALQKERRAIASAPPAVARNAPVEAATAPVPVPAPVPRAQPRPAPVADATPAARVDGIGNFLRGDARRDGQKLQTDAFAALIKLGYPLHGEAATSPATIQALQDFQKTHGLPASRDVNAKTLKQLNAAVAAAAH